MRHPSTVYAFLMLIALAGLLGLPAGCASRALPPLPESAARPAAAASAAPTDPSQAAAAAQSAAQHLAAALAQPPAANEPLGEPPPVRWIATHRKPSADAPAGRASATPGLTKVADAPPVPSDAAAAPAAEAHRAGPVPAASGDAQALLEQLRQALRTSHDPALARAVAAAGLSLADPAHRLDPADLAGLTAPQRDLVQRYQQALVALGEQIAAGQTALNADVIAEQLDRLAGPQPLKLRVVQLCKRVRGYGVYDPFENQTLLAGKDQKLIVYVELDHLTAAKTPVGTHLVRLTQEVVLYNEADGLAVWRQPQVDIADESRNVRRDFFVVQLVELPARLSVGKYLLKVRVTDRNGGSMDEATVPVQVVADQALAGGK